MKARQTLAAVAVAAMLFAPAVVATASASPGERPAPPPQSTDRPLRDLAKPTGLRIGTAVDMSALANDATYRHKVAQEFDTVTAENVMKWESLEPQRGVYTYEEADKLIAFAKKNGQKVRGHTLLWHNQNPAWLTNGDFTSAELRAILREHVINTVRHFKGKIWQWDVANEVIDDNAQLRNSFWLQKLGPSYISDVFRWAREADPKAKLFINDYNVEDVNAKSNAYYALVQQLRAEGVPIDGFGAQGHHTTGYAPRTMQQNLQRFQDLGMDTAVTEVDVRMPMPSDNTKMQAQANVYSTMLKACLLTSRCISYTVWGFTDKYSWVPGVFPGQGAANILTENYDPKPAYRALQSDFAVAGGVPHRN